MTVPDYSDPTPAYAQIAGDLRDLISAGTYAPGDRLPSNKALSEKYGVADGTIRQALETLRGEGVIATQSTRGTFVLSTPATGRQNTPKPVGEQLEEIRHEISAIAELAESAPPPVLADIRETVGRLEANLIALYGMTGHAYPEGGSNDSAETAPARRSRR